jgi:hypothetical protein
MCTQCQGGPRSGADRRAGKHPEGHEHSRSQVASNRPGWGPRDQEPEPDEAGGEGRRVRRCRHMCTPTPQENRTRCGRIMCKTNHNLLIIVLHQLRMPLLGTSVGAVHRNQVHRLDIRQSLPTRPDSAILLYLRAACAQVSKKGVTSSQFLRVRRLWSSQFCTSKLAPQLAHLVNRDKEGIPPACSLGRFRGRFRGAASAALTRGY